jgi:hypothetical protein
MFQFLRWVSMHAGTIIQRSVLSLMTLLACSASNAWANDCQIQLTQPVVDYGSINPHVLTASAKAAPTAALGKRLLQLNIVCTEPKDMAVSFQGLASGLHSYRLSDKGEFDLTFKNARLDGESVLLGSVSSFTDSPGEASAVRKLKPGQYLVPVLNQQRQSGKSLSMGLEVDARLFVDGLKIRDVVTLDGQGQFELNP